VDKFYISNFLFVGKFIRNKKIFLLMDLLTKKTNKNKLPASFRRYFPEQNIVSNFVGNYLKIF